MATIFKKKLIFFFTWLIHVPPLIGQETIIMLDPAGSKTKGRKLSHGYERGATLMLAHVIQKQLALNEFFIPLITRNAGEAHQPFYATSFSNRVNPKLFVHLSIFKHENPKPSLFIYYRCTNRFTNFTQQIHNQLEFIPLEKSHLFSIKNSKQIATSLKTKLEANNGQKLVEIYNPLGIPLTSLYGIISPSIHLEIGVDDEHKLATLGIELAKALIKSI